jgi:hypothetical protein
MSEHTNIVITYTFIFAYVPKNVALTRYGCQLIRPTRLEQPSSA